MKYVLLIYHVEKEGERTPDSLGPWLEFSRRAADFGKEYAGAPLDYSRFAKTVSVRDGELQVTDGPFAETKEQLCGYYLFDCESREDAVKLASMIPLAPVGHVE